MGYPAFPERSMRARPRANLNGDCHYLAGQGGEENLMIRVASAALAFSCLALQPVQAQEPLRIGFLTVRTGALAAGGRQMEEGINLFLKERNSTLSGRKVE